MQNAMPTAAQETRIMRCWTGHALRPSFVVHLLFSANEVEQRLTPASAIVIQSNLEIIRRSVLQTSE